MGYEQLLLVHFETAVGLEYVFQKVMKEQYLYVKVIPLIFDCSGIVDSSSVCGRSRAVILN
jgi:hypothetical protein